MIFFFSETEETDLGEILMLNRIESMRFLLFEGVCMLEDKTSLKPSDFEFKVFMDVV